ncbi:hypothetical protein C8F01DRAFT_1253910 [Mycena amicta]|nr:hypothetical protein C8F01DRAFT_1253910 [Mycena amicta]
MNSENYDVWPLPLETLAEPSLMALDASGRVPFHVDPEAKPECDIWDKKNPAEIDMDVSEAVAREFERHFGDPTEMDMYISETPEFERHFGDRDLLRLRPLQFVLPESHNKLTLAAMEQIELGGRKQAEGVERLVPPSNRLGVPPSTNANPSRPNVPRPTAPAVASTPARGDGWHPHAGSRGNDSANQEEVNNAHGQSRSPMVVQSNGTSTSNVGQPPPVENSGITLTQLQGENLSFSDLVALTRIQSPGVIVPFVKGDPRPTPMGPPQYIPVKPALAPGTMPQEILEPRLDEMLRAVTVDWDKVTPKDDDVDSEEDESDPMAWIHKTAGVDWEAVNASNNKITKAKGGLKRSRAVVEAEMAADGATAHAASTQDATAPVAKRQRINQKGKSLSVRDQSTSPVIPGESPAASPVVDALTPVYRAIDYYKLDEGTGQHVCLWPGPRGPENVGKLCGHSVKTANGIKRHLRDKHFSKENVGSGVKG